MNLIHNMCSKITLLKLLPHLPGLNESNHFVYQMIYHNDMMYGQNIHHVLIVITEGPLLLTWFNLNPSMEK